MNFYKVSRQPLLRGGIFVLMGLLLCLFPDFILHSAAIFLGLLLVISAVIILYQLNFVSGLRAHANLLLVPIVISLTCGIYVIIKPSSATSVIFIAMGIWLFIAGVAGIVHSFYKGAGIRTDRWEFLASMTVLIFALIIFEDPAGAAMLLIYGGGVYLLLCGCVFITVNLCLRKRPKITLDEINSYLPPFMRSSSRRLL